MACLIRFCRLFARFGRAPDKLGGQVPQAGKLARFVYDSGRLRPGTFKPTPHQHRLELSTAQRSCVTEKRLWHLGRTKRPDRTLHGRCDFEVRQLPEGLISREAAEKGYQEHAVVVGWPDDREEQLKLQVALVKAAPLKQCPGN